MRPSSRTFRAPLIYSHGSVPGLPFTTEKSWLFILIARVVHLSNDIISPKLRWLAIATGCVVASTGVLLQWTDPIGPAFLALGAAIQPRSSRPGRWLMWLSALSTNVWTSAIAVALLREIKTGNFPLPALAIYLAFALLLWCDVALVMDAMSPARRQADRVQASSGILDWVVWIAALVWSSYFVWWTVLAVRAYRLNVRFDILLTALGLDAAVLFFDIALIIHALKSRRTE
jgi:hypothetical protein